MKLPPMEYRLLDQREAAIGHFQVLINGSLWDVKQLFIAFPLLGDALLSFSTRNTPNAIGFEAESKLLVPILLFLGKEDKPLVAITAFPFYVEIVRNRNGCRSLPR